MAAPAGSNMSTTADTLALLPQFLDLLRSTSPPPIPSETLLGAITHFLARLDSPHLDDFVKALFRSPSIWNSRLLSQQEICNAIRLSVSGRISKISQDTNDVYFADSRKSRRAKHWLSTVLKHTDESHDTAHRLIFHIGLLQGIDDVEDLDWGKGRVKLEEEIVMAVGTPAGSLGHPVNQEMTLSSVLPLIATERLQVLDMESMACRIESHLFNQDPDSAQNRTLDTARALARTFEVMSFGGPTTQANARKRMIGFCQRAQARAAEMGGEWELRADSEQRKDVSFEKHTTTLNSLLTTVSTMVDILLSSNRAAGILQPSTSDVAVHTLLLLGSFAYLTDANDGAFENYHKVLYGSLDMISSSKDNESVRTLFTHLAAKGRLTEARAAFVLVLGDELINHLGKKEIDLLFPLAERHVYRPKHKASFEASHAFLLSLIKASADSLEKDDSQAAFFDAILPDYLNILAKQYAQNDINSEQFRQAFPILVEASSKRSSQAVQSCMTYLSTLPVDKEIRHIRIAIAPYAESNKLPAYLEEVAEAILSTEKYSEERMDLTKDAFEMVVKGLSDANKKVGMDWWARRRGELVGGRQKDPGFVRSRL
ncbi:uncharacterized protein I303_108299 [Kwoniella dejecticola CBS 10117]|uniref:Uncharacterized protein n=1 Tax=Kwoniella dejecticola CBS 10117 TaxID=1296121 RepID=A0A1A5ZXS6_9TREE|nr:uncharacterized protein I303_07374 [Kwoniella dejecticola CBS 10117]OBR82612.1 hypothetical protein I303_07374 [Kwoniella dejecticola CBS 10117]